MSEPKFTKAPWFVHDELKRSVAFNGRDGVENLFTEDLEGYFCCQNEADAHLIAAAPDLYAALIECLEAVEEYYQEDAKFILEAKAALKKARGE